MPIVEDETDDLPVDESAQEESQDQPEQDAEDNASAETEVDAEDEGGEVVISLGDPAQEPEPEVSGTGLLKQLRKQKLHDDKRIRKLEAELQEIRAAKGGGEAQQRDPGPQPKMDDPDVDFDPDLYAAKLLKWHEAKRAVDEAKAQAEKADRDAREAFEAKRQRYHEGIKALPVRDAEEAHDAVSVALNQTQQGIILHAADEPHKLVYALARNPTELERISKISDPVLFAREIGRLETKVQTTTRKPATQPETKVKAGGTTISRNATLDKLRAEAERTGDYTEVRKFKQAQRAAS